MMPDRRRWPANTRVAAARLKGEVAVDRFVDPVTRAVVLPVADLKAAPGGRRDRQVLFGERLNVYEVADGHAFVEAQKDGYTGYVAEAALAEAPAPTHIVCTAATHVYPAADIKVPERFGLSLGARVQVIGTDAKFAQTPEGFIPIRHLRPLDSPEPDPVAVSERLIGTPYLWGGNSRAGIDCSGLVQAGCVACGIACPGDSDMQERELGAALPEDATLKRGDLLFWKGHVAWVADETRILHANGFDMAVVYEGIDAAIARIEAQGDGKVTARRRLG
ncbi:C40 family peptidase [Pseudooceanicola sp. LIPI14-2-Ac024]|uniref:C40 family peptidase n=1 Tax=Pseudooceanicola sp. LIPI14-2-Ac024 TaxID=3344875 RepID=UPI0035D11BF0